MKKVLFVAAAAGLMSLAACQPAATNNTADANAVDANAGTYESLGGNEADGNAVPAEANTVVANEGEVVANTAP